MLSIVFQVLALFLFNKCWTLCNIENLIVVWYKHNKSQDHQWSPWPDPQSCCSDHLKIVLFRAWTTCVKTVGHGCGSAEWINRNLVLHEIKKILKYCTFSNHLTETHQTGDSALLIEIIHWNLLTCHMLGCYEQEKNISNFSISIKLNSIVKRSISIHMTTFLMVYAQFMLKIVHRFLVILSTSYAWRIEQPTRQCP